MALQRATNLDTQTAANWVNVLQTRGIETSTFQTSLVRLSKQMETGRTKSNDYAQKIRDLTVEMAAVRATGGKDMEKQLGKLGDQLERARAGAEKARAPFTQLGVNFQQVKAGNVQEVLLQVADGLAKVENPAKRAAIAQQLFGKAGQKLLPILMSGRKGIEDQLNTAEKYVKFTDKQVAQQKKVVAAQRELALAHKGVQIAIGSALLPAQVELYQTLLHITQAIFPFIDNINVMKGVLIAAGVAMTAFKVATIAGALAQAGVTASSIAAAAGWVASTAALIANTVATWAQVAASTALDIAMSPITLIVLAIVAAIVALVAIGYLLYKNWDSIAALAGTVWNAIKAGAMAVFNWLRSNWPLLLPLLLGPFGVLPALIIRYWSQIKAGIVAALNAIKSAVVAGWNALVSVTTSTGNAIRSAAVSAWNAVRGAVSTAMNAIRSVVSAGMAAVTAVVRAAWNAIVAVIRGAAGKAGAAARAVVAAIKGAFSGAAGWLVGAGRAIVQGLVNGIESMVGRVQAAAQKIADAAKKVISGPLGFITGSPSKWAHRVGTDVGQGLANGIEAGIPPAVKAARALAKRTMDAAQATLQARAGSLQNYLQQAFQTRQAAAKTPAEQALEDLQAAHDDAQRAQALADAQAQMAAAQTDEERLSAQQAYNDAAYAIQVAALQKQADAERIELQGRQFVQQQAFDNSLKALNTYLSSAHATAAGARKRINTLMTQYGIDFASVGDLLGSSFATGIENSTDAVVKAANKLAAAVRNALKRGLKIGSPSKVAANYGYEVARGLALGISRNAGLVNNAFALAMPSGASPLVGATIGGVNVHVYIGDQELRGLVRTEIVTDNTRVARRLLAGAG